LPAKRRVEDSPDALSDAADPDLPGEADERRQLVARALAMVERE
jgi:hypothetical protein